MPFTLSLLGRQPALVGRSAREALRQARAQLGTSNHADERLPAVNTGGGVTVALTAEYDLPGCCTLTVEGPIKGTEAWYAAKLAVYFNYHDTKCDLLNKTVKYFAKKYPGKLAEGALRRMSRAQERGERAAAMLVMDYDQLKLMCTKLVPDKAQLITDQVLKASGREQTVSSGTLATVAGATSNAEPAQAAASNGPATVDETGGGPASRAMVGNQGMTFQAARAQLANLLVDWALQSPYITKQQVNSEERAVFKVRQRTAEGQIMVQKLTVVVSGPELPILRDKVRSPDFADTFTKAGINSFRQVEQHYTCNVALSVAMAHIKLEEPERFSCTFVQQQQDQQLLTTTGPITMDDDTTQLADSGVRLAKDPNIPVVTALDGPSVSSIDLADFDPQTNSSQTIGEQSPDGGDASNGATRASASQMLGWGTGAKAAPDATFHISGTAFELKMLAMALQEYLCDSLGVVRGSGPQRAWFPADGRISLQWFPLADDTSGRGLTKVPGVHRLRVREQDGATRETILSNSQLQGLMYALDSFLGSTPSWHDAVYPPPPLSMPPYRPAVFSWLRPLAGAALYVGLAGLALLPFVAAFWRQRPLPRPSVPGPAIAHMQSMPRGTQADSAVCASSQWLPYNDKVSTYEMDAVCSTITEQLQIGWIPRELTRVDGRECRFQVVADADDGAICGCQPLDLGALSLWNDLPVTASMRPAKYKEQYVTWQRQLAAANNPPGKSKVKQVSPPDPVGIMSVSPSRPVVLAVSVTPHSSRQQVDGELKCSVDFMVKTRPWQNEDSWRQWGYTLPADTSTKLN
ncbi:hypothetical protein WJX72_000844 [[Myrmecia] bisecta]|uniref:Uncharacterized protein n=1 Tax=[Myrmecia] bisecta TaxID=41462 RepID=A0AAW1QPX9_9CHLO